MDQEKAIQLNELLDKLADQLNISKEKEDRAVTAYGSVGGWLDDDPRVDDGEIYPQGSFRLGTVVRPLSGDDDGYDIDLVYCMSSLVAAPAKLIKAIPGERLREHGTYGPKLEPEGKRCWTLAYEGFHMDILPCTDDVAAASGTAIRLTHRREDGSYSDKFSDPRSYADWFEGRMGDSLAIAKERYAGEISCSVDDVKTFQVRTTLQKAVQILKHHRNLMFEDDDDAPISIIITTLAALGYSGEAGVYDALRSILGRMDGFIEQGPRGYRIENPVDPKENFADKWNEEPAKARAFFRWLYQARTDLAAMETARGMVQLHEALENFAGGTMANRAYKAYGEGIKESRNGGRLFASAAGVASAAAAPAANAVPVKGHTFYG